MGQVFCEMCHAVQDEEQQDKWGSVILSLLKENLFGGAHLRTLQRRVKDWRGVTAKRLVYAASDEPVSERSEQVELVLVGVGNKG